MLSTKSNILHILHTKSEVPLFQQSLNRCLIWTKSWVSFCSVRSSLLLFINCIKVFHHNVFTDHHHIIGSLHYHYITTLRYLNRIYRIKNFSESFTSHWLSSNTDEFPIRSDGCWHCRGWLWWQLLSVVRPAELPPLSAQRQKLTKSGTRGSRKTPSWIKHCGRQKNGLDWILGVREVVKMVDLCISGVVVVSGFDPLKGDTVEWKSRLISVLLLCCGRGSPLLCTFLLAAYLVS